MIHIAIGAAFTILWIVKYREIWIDSILFRDKKGAAITYGYYAWIVFAAIYL